MGREARKQLMADTLLCLRVGYGVQHVGEIRGAAIVADSWPHAAYYYSVNDNGGEFHVHRINSSTPGDSAAYETMNGDMNAGTMAYRVASLMRDEKIDWKLFLTEEDVSIMKQTATQRCHVAGTQVTCETISAQR